jgi:hypothetical protein
LIDLDIEKTICAAIDQSIGDDCTLDFSCSIDGYFNAVWLGRENAWRSPLRADALSCVLIANQIEPAGKGYDNIAIATVAKYFDRRLIWVDSFQFAWQGYPNHGMSISGYLMGRKLRSLYIK